MNGRTTVYTSIYEVRGRAITGVVMLVIVLFTIACQKCHSQSKDRLTRKAERQKERLACDTLNIRRYIETTIVTSIDISWNDSAIVVTQQNGYGKTYFFCECNKVKGQNYYEVSNADGSEAGFIIIDQNGIEFNLFTLEKLYRFRDMWQVKIQHGFPQIREEPLKVKSKQT